MRVKVVDTREGYDRWAPTYDVTGNPLIAIETVALDEMLGPVRGLKTVDLGCGTGRNTIRLHDLGAKVEGLDFSEGMLGRARELSEDRPIQFIQADLNRPLPYPARTFDLVVSSLVIEHIRDLVYFFREAGRICRTDGRIYISDLHPAMRLKDARAQFTDRRTGADVRPRGYAHSMSDYMLALRDSDLAVEDVREYSGCDKLAKAVPKMRKYVDWPMLVVFKLRPSPAGL